MNFTPLFIAGQVLLWIGFLGGAFFTVLRLENTDAAWSTIPWGYYGVAALVGIGGVVLLRLNKAAQAVNVESTGAELTAVQESLSKASERVANLRGSLEDMSCEDVLEYIDEECAPLLADFADGRMSISNRFGTKRYAEVMTEFASGERYLNRAWSAAADGYVDEVDASVGHANAFLFAAVSSLQNASQNKENFSA